MKIIKVLILLGSGLVLACTPTSAPVVDKSATQGGVPAVHIVRDNENLFLVAMKYDLDYQKLGQINGISYPYKLQTGQRVKLRGDNISDNPVKIVVDEEEPVIKPPQASKITDKPVSIDKQRTIGGIKWQWPLKGTLVKTYATTPDNYKGIDIKADSGASVRAAANGIVVYVGDGLAKYGNLIIVSHKDIYLSAYAQLSKIMVDEGQKVRVGEKIATLGSKTLHFEIRKDAETLDPQKLLP